ncbi:MAG: hypothetical protein GF411_14250 [Candidatus Lokiarchaeota archaeon]|nr:hypothetical protein [Candidatus Lokiarchaeota archaeon]
MNILNLEEKIDPKYRGEIEIIIKDRNGNVIERVVEPNIVKIFAKEILSHTMPFSKVWDPNASSGSGGWVDSEIDPNEDFAVKYILLGASFDANGIPLDTEDTRFYTLDPVTDTYKPIRLEPGAWYDGGLINAIPIADPDRPLKRIERFSFEPTYQPAGSPLLQEDVRAINNVLKAETTLRTDEYNGFGLTDTDFFTITEVALAAGKTIDGLDSCDCTPRELFLDGPYPATLTGGDVVTLDDTSDVLSITAGDQIKITGAGSEEDLDQVTPFYLVLDKAETGRDIQLDRVPVDADNDPLTGSVQLWRDTLRIFSHRILSSPVKKSNVFEITIRWSIIFN